MLMVSVMNQTNLKLSNLERERQIESERERDRVIER